MLSLKSLLVALCPKTKKGSSGWFPDRGLPLFSSNIRAQQKKIHIKKGDCVADVRQQPGIRQSSAQPRQRPHTQQPPTHGDDGRDDFTKRTLCSVQVASQIDALGEGGDGGERGGGKNNKKNCHHQNHQWNTITADENTHLVYREGPPPFPCYVLVRYLHFSQVLMWDAPKGKKKKKSR